MKRDNRILSAIFLQILMWISAIAWYRMLGARIRRTDTNFINNYMPHMPEMFAFFFALLCGFLTLLILGWTWWRPKP